MKKKSSELRKAVRNIAPKLLVVSVVFGLLLTVPVERASAKGRPWLIDVLNDAKADGTIRIWFILTGDPWKEQVEVILIEIEVKAGQTRQQIRDAILRAMAHTFFPLSAGKTSYGSILWVEVHDNFDCRRPWSIDNILVNPGATGVHFNYWDP